MSKYTVNTPDREEFYKQMRRGKYLFYNLKVIVRILLFALGFILAISIFDITKGENLYIEAGILLAVYLLGELIIVKPLSKSNKLSSYIFIMILLVLGIIGAFLYGRELYVKIEEVYVYLKENPAVAIVGAIILSIFITSAIRGWKGEYYMDCDDYKRRNDEFYYYYYRN